MISDPTRRAPEREPTGRERAGSGVQIRASLSSVSPQHQTTATLRPRRSSLGSALAGLLASSELPARAAAFYSRLPGLAPPPGAPGARTHPAPPRPPSPSRGSVLPLTEVGGLWGPDPGGLWRQLGKPQTQAGEPRLGQAAPPGEGAGAQDERGRPPRVVAVEARFASSGLPRGQGTGRRERRKACDFHRVTTTLHSDC